MSVTKCSKYNLFLIISLFSSYFFFISVNTWSFVEFVMICNAFYFCLWIDFIHRTDKGRLLLHIILLKSANAENHALFPICLHSKMKFLTRYDMWSVIFYISLNEFFTVTKNPDRNVTKLIWNLSKWPNFIKNCETFFSR